MAAELVLAPEAEADLAEAYGWYETRRIGLGEEFLGCVDACIQQVLRWPRMYATIHQQYRRALVRRFPYVVFYEVSEEESVTVYAVFHTSRDPNRWRARLS